MRKPLEIDNWQLFPLNVGAPLKRAYSKIWKYIDILESNGPFSSLARFLTSPFCRYIGNCGLYYTGKIGDRP